MRGDRAQVKRAAGLLDVPDRRRDFIPTTLPRQRLQGVGPTFLEVTYVIRTESAATIERNAHAGQRCACEDGRTEVRFVFRALA